jgi:hypothetical protein
MASRIGAPTGRVCRLGCCQKRGALFVELLDVIAKTRSLAIANTTELCAARCAGAKLILCPLLVT